LRNDLRSRVASGAVTALLLTTAASTTSCAAIINRDPNLRWWAFKTYGSERICPEVLKTSVPLKLNGERSATIGRYFPESCSYSIDEQSRTVIVNISGSGYAYLPTAKRTSFTMTTAVEYAFDFFLHDDGNWVWGKMKRIAGGPEFKLINTDNKILDIAGVITPAGPAANVFGGQVVSGLIARGFTVVETDEGKEFSLGILPPGVRPFKPIMVDDDDDELTFTNETAEVYANQQDFLGPFEVASDGQAIVLKGNLVGAAPVDFVVIDEPRGDIWRNAYQLQGSTAPPGPPIASVTVQPGPFTRKFPLRRGLYYVVVDNSSAVGQASPAFQLPNPLFDNVARLGYVAQLIDD
jgi:hypothetical protein